MNTKKIGKFEFSELKSYIPVGSVWIDSFLFFICFVFQTMAHKKHELFAVVYIYIPTSHRGSRSTTVQSTTTTRSGFLCPVDSRTGTFNLNTPFQFETRSSLDKRGFTHVGNAKECNATSLHVYRNSRNEKKQKTFKLCSHGIVHNNFTLFRDGSQNFWLNIFENPLWESARDVTTGEK